MYDVQPDNIILLADEEGIISLKICPGEAVNISNFPPKFALGSERTTTPRSLSAVINHNFVLTRCV